MKIVDADFEVASAYRATLGESPMWCMRRQTLYWVDVRGPTLFSLDGSKWQLPEIVGGVALADDGSLVLAMKSGLARFRDGKLDPYVELEPRDLDNRLNDIKCDRRGRLWVGTMRDFGAAATGSLYRVDRAVVDRVLGGVTIPNGPCWSPDGRTFYFADSMRNVIWAYDYDPQSGAIANERPFFAGFDRGSPDGSAVDEQGRLWNCRFGGGCVVCVAPDGKIDRVVDLPVTHATTCAFGGPDLKTLFITTATIWTTESDRLAGSLFAIRTDVAGVDGFKARC